MIHHFHYFPVHNAALTCICRRAGEGLESYRKCHRVRERTSRGRRREAPVAGAAGTPPAGLRVRWCSQGRALGCLWSSAGKHRLHRAICPVTAPQLLRAPRRGLHVATVTRAVSCQSWLSRSRTDRPSCRNALLWGRREGASPPFCLPELVLEQYLWFCQRLGVSGHPQRMPQGSPCAAASLRGPLSSALPGTDCNVSGCSAPNPHSTADVRVVKAAAVFISYRNIFFFPGTVAGNNCCSIKTYKGFSEVWFSHKRPGIFLSLPWMLLTRHTSLRQP